VAGSSSGVGGGRDRELEAAVHVQAYLPIGLNVLFRYRLFSIAPAVGRWSAATG
jgi:hypothetical protein